TPFEREFHVDPGPGILGSKRTRPTPEAAAGFRRTAILSSKLRRVCKHCPQVNLTDLFCQRQCAQCCSDALHNNAPAFPSRSCRMAASQLFLSEPCPCISQTAKWINLCHIAIEYCASMKLEWISRLEQFLERNDFGKNWDGAYQDAVPTLRQLFHREGFRTYITSEWESPSRHPELVEIGRASCRERVRVSEGTRGAV